MNDERRLYHVTPAHNRVSIGKIGLDPKLSLGKRQVVWLVEAPALLWALSHCSARHAVPFDHLMVVIAHVNLSRVKRTKWQGVYTADFRVIAQAFESAAEYLFDYEEKNRYPHANED